MPSSNACTLQCIFLLEAAARQSLSRQPRRDSPLQAAVQVLLSSSASQEMRHAATSPLLLTRHTHIFLAFTVGACMLHVTSLPVDDLIDSHDRGPGDTATGDARSSRFLWIISSGEQGAFLNIFYS